MASKKEYLDRLKLAIEQMHGCTAAWSASMPVHEKFHGRTVWKGVVETFNLTNHPQAKRCYAWFHTEGKRDHNEQFVALLEIPPVQDAATAVRVQILKDGNSKFAK